MAVRPKKDLDAYIERKMDVRTRFGDDALRPPGNKGAQYATYPRFVFPKRGESPHNGSYGSGAKGSGTYGP